MVGGVTDADCFRSGHHGRGPLSTVVLYIHKWNRLYVDDWPVPRVFMRNSRRVG